VANGPHAVFRDIPETPLLTMNLDIPQAWMVEAVKSPYDLDNIYLKEVRIETKRIHYAPQDVLQFYICMFINVFVTTSDMLSPHVYILQVDQSVIGNFELEYILIEGMLTRGYYSCHPES
jgi:hypothetical protein